MVLQMELAAVERARHVSESRPDEEEHDVLQCPFALEVEVVDEIVLDFAEYPKRHPLITIHAHAGMKPLMKSNAETAAVV